MAIRLTCCGVYHWNRIFLSGTVLPHARRVIYRLHINLLAIQQRLRPGRSRMRTIRQLHF